MEKLTDEEIVKTLTIHRGIGIWTAQMLLIFNLGRLRLCGLSQTSASGEATRSPMVWMNFPCHPNYVTSVIAGSRSVALPVGIYGGQMTSKLVVTEFIVGSDVRRLFSHGSFSKELDQNQLIPPAPDPNFAMLIGRSWISTQK